MSKHSESKTIDQLMAEADELMQQINSDTIKNMNEEHQLEMEIHAQNLEKIKTGIQANTGDGHTPGVLSSADGMHEAILDIVKAMHNLKKKMF